MKKFIKIAVLYLIGISIMFIIDIKYSLNLSWWLYFLFGGSLLIGILLLIDMLPSKQHIKDIFVPKPNKQKVIRELAKIRIKKSAIFKGLENQIVSEIINMPDDLLISLPEGSIVTIIETYLQLRSEGMPENEIIKNIEIVRSANFALISGDPMQLESSPENLPPNLTLDNYIRYRINKELDWAISNGLISLPIRVSFSKEVLDELIKESFLFFKIK
ncbi:MAG: hypothetical protein C4567_07870 [Deltaproteobacteria bacterium]|nr:MAG: hypothetical protein C4567_07870 [Deltaproteobacteria bacterium]